MFILIYLFEMKWMNRPSSFQKQKQNKHFSFLSDLFCSRSRYVCCTKSDACCTESVFYCAHYCRSNSRRRKQALVDSRWSPAKIASRHSLLRPIDLAIRYFAKVSSRDIKYYIVNSKTRH